MSEAGATAGRQTNTASASGSAGGDNTTTTFSERVRSQLRGNPIVILLVAGAASIAVIAALMMWASSPDYRVLYNNLDEADGGRIITELDSRGVPYRFSNNGQALMVPSDRVHPLRLYLAEQGLPRGGNVGLELMDDQAFGISQFAEQVNYQRGLEGELSSSIESLGPVEGARVHLSMAKPSVFIRDREPAKASVVLTLLPGRLLGDGQVSAIVHMVSSSVPELAPEDVSVVDQNGRLLSADTGGSDDLDGSQLEYLAEVERSYQQRIENILTPILGEDNVRAQVAAQVDFSQREETSERYGPNQPPNEAAVRSRQLSVSLDGENPLGTGIPGALSNTPPGTAPSPINQPDEEGEDGADGEGDEALRNLRQDDVVNYEVDRSIEHIQHRLGRIERLTAAVVVNYRQTVNEEGEQEQVPLSAEEVQQIEGLVRQSMGFSEARGDAIDVVNTPFADIEDDTPDAPEWWQRQDTLELAAQLGRYLLVALAALLLYLLILRPLIKRYTESPVMATATPGGALQTQVGDDEDEPDEDADSNDSEETYQKPKRRRKTSLYEHNLNDLREMAQEDPRMVAMIVRSWMNANE
ncbi:flagellar basal-body MS-ring/collar protein FliF [Vreelandella gomseomensis]|uniref:Flagellar M-ring protein n=1 Tax=Vreelandella gomseomensis TaxID=370766 RepID=A0ABU1GCR9_9GAMM|nr:flagellar basal-body MS-ring/collar protein FliF [Halomonas gomseomensis]MDR5875278.1 flagellar basal-body MS-ring/collar protein FliF [Halomonas gomseomensis]